MNRKKRILLCMCLTGIALTSAAYYTFSSCKSPITKVDPGIAAFVDQITVAWYLKDGIAGEADFGSAQTDSIASNIAIHYGIGLIDKKGKAIGCMGGIYHTKQIKRKLRWGDTGENNLKKLDLDELRVYLTFEIVDANNEVLYKGHKYSKPMRHDELTRVRADDAQTKANIIARTKAKTALAPQSPGSNAE